MNSELDDVYRRPGLPVACAGYLGGCALGNCEGLAAVTVFERIATRTGSLLGQESGEYCPLYQVAMPDGRVYTR